MSKLAVILQGDPASFQSAFSRGGLAASMLAGDPGFFGFIKRAISGLGQVISGIRRPRTTTAVERAVGAPPAGTLAKLGALVKRHPELAAVLAAAGIAIPAIGAAETVIGAARAVFGRRAAAAPEVAGRFRRIRGRGITAAQLKGFKKVTRLLGTLGMVPRHLGHVRVQRGRRRRF